jgi:hypothetical protein
MRKILGIEVTFGRILLWVISVVFVGAIIGPLITDTVLDWRREFVKKKDIGIKKEILRQRQEEDLKVWEDSVRMSLDAKYAPQLRPLYEKLQEAETDGLGGSGIVTASRMKITAVKNREEAEFNELLRIRKRDMKRQIEDLELK